MDGTSYNYIQRQEKEGDRGGGLSAYLVIFFAVQLGWARPMSLNW